MASTAKEPFVDRGKRHFELDGRARRLPHTGDSQVARVNGSRAQSRVTRTPAAPSDGHFRFRRADGRYFARSEMPRRAMRRHPAACALLRAGSIGYFRHHASHFVLWILAYIGPLVLCTLALPFFPEAARANGRSTVVPPISFACVSVTHFACHRRPLDDLGLFCVAERRAVATRIEGRCIGRNNPVIRRMDGNGDRASAAL
jgi:hypothetical protein